MGRTVDGFGAGGGPDEGVGGGGTDGGGTEGLPTNGGRDLAPFPGEGEFRLDSDCPITALMFRTVPNFKLTSLFGVGL